MLTRIYNSGLILLFCLFLIHLIRNLEKVILINEILSMTGMLVLMLNFRRFYKKKIDWSFFTYSLILGYFSLYVVYSILFLKEGTWYQAFRTLPFWYSIFAFFVGIEFYRLFNTDPVKKIFKKAGKLLTIGSLFLGGRLSNPIVFPIILARTKHFFVGVFSLLILVYLTKIHKEDGSSTAILYVLFFVLFIMSFYLKVVRDIIFNKFFILGFFCCLFIVLNYVYNEFNEYYTIGISMFGEDQDPNLIWRLMYWSFEINHNLLSHPLTGIGFCTPMFDIESPEAMFIIIATPNDPDLPYTHGTHNSFIYAFIRTGIIGGVMILVFVTGLFRRFFKFNLHKDRQAVVFAVCFLIINVAALFNVIMESALYAGVYWVMAGMFYGAIRQGILKNEESKS